jgi:hypothetical protein
LEKERLQKVRELIKQRLVEGKPVERNLFRELEKRKKKEERTLELNKYEKKENILQKYRITENDIPKKFQSLLIRKKDLVASQKNELNKRRCLSLVETETFPHTDYNQTFKLNDKKCFMKRVHSSDALYSVITADCSDTFDKKGTQPLATFGNSLDATNILTHFKKGFFFFFFFFF